MKYFLVVGEASGDLHASHLMRELLKTDPRAEFMFFGGDKMAEVTGTQPIIHYRKMAFMGFWTVLKNAKTIGDNWKKCQNSMVNFSPHVVILVDYPSFNLRIAQYVKRQLPDTKVYYYISPKIWAWKTYRIHSIKKYVDEMFTILPFETAFYQQYGYPVNYVGNPTVDSVSDSRHREINRQTFQRKYGLSDKPIIALLPGSRKQEILSCLPKMITACLYLEDMQMIVTVAPGIDRSFYATLLRDTNNVALVEDDTYSVVAQSEIAIVNSGTASLETCLIGTPQIVVYHVWGGRFTLWIKDMLLKVKYISLVNLIADRMVVKELIGYNFTPQTLRMEMEKLRNDDDSLRLMLSGYQDVQSKLGDKGCAQYTAQLMYEKLSCSLK